MYDGLSIPARRVYEQRSVREGSRCLGSSKPYTVTVGLDLSSETNNCFVIRS